MDNKLTTIHKLAETIKSILTEREFNARWEVLQCYHEIGFELNNWCEKNKEPLAEICHAVAKRIDRTPRTLYKAAQFAEKYPDINKLPHGKVISWHKVVNELLPSGEREECKHENTQKVEICLSCHRRL